MKNPFARPDDKGKIELFEILTLRESGMRATIIYEMTAKDGAALVTQYRLRYSGEGEERVAERQATCDMQTALRLLNDCRLLSWDGFHGPHPRHVRDGTMFTLQATVNGDRRISADGSQNFPRHYRELLDGIRAILEG